MRFIIITSTLPWSFWSVRTYFVALVYRRGVLGVPCGAAGTPSVARSGSPLASKMLPTKMAALSLFGSAGVVDRTFNLNRCRFCSNVAREQYVSSGQRGVKGDSNGQEVVSYSFNGR